VVQYIRREDECKGSSGRAHGRSKMVVPSTGGRLYNPGESTAIHRRSRTTLVDVKTLALTTSLAIALGAARLAPAQDSKVSTAEINAALNSPDSFVRHNTWVKLNAEDGGHYKALVQILKSLPWYDRDGAIIALAKAATEETLAKMAKDLKENKDPLVRQGMALALAKMNDDKIYSRLYDALKDKDPVVRRMVVHALRVHRKNDAVQALIDAFQNEQDPVVKSFMVDSLNQLTQAFQGPTPTAWFTWWEQAKADPSYKLGETNAEAIAKAEELGNKLKKRATVSAAGGVTLETEERGGAGKTVGVPILVLPYYGDSVDVMKPFLSELEQTNKLFYIKLPPITSFKNIEVVSQQKIPYYPIDNLVKAFEDLRKETGQDRFALMACGLNTWIAMRYASLYPQAVSHLVLVCPVSSYDAYGKGVDRMERKGKSTKDLELEHLAMTQTFNRETGESSHDIYHREKKLPKPEGEEASLSRRDWSLYFKEERDSLASMLYPIKDDKQVSGRTAIPPFNAFKEPKRNIPTIVIVGAGSLFASPQDCEAIAKHYAGACYVYPNSSSLPFAEESTTFNKHMAALLRERVKASGKDKKAKEKKEAKAKKAGKTGVAEPGKESPN
jgi:proline iminopeptidase